MPATVLLGLQQQRKMTEIPALVELTLQWWRVSPKANKGKYAVFQIMIKVEKVKQEREVGRVAGGAGKFTRWSGKPLMTRRYLIKDLKKVS